MRRPRKANVAGYVFNIIWLTEKQWLDKFSEEDKHMSGLCFHGTLEIYVRLGVYGAPTTEIILKEILLHELLHACMAVSDVTNTLKVLKKDCIEEAVVGATSPALLTVLRHNKELTRYLLAPVD